MERALVWGGGDELRGALVIEALRVYCRRFSRSTQIITRSAVLTSAFPYNVTRTVVASAGWKLWTQQGAEFSPSGLVISALAIPTMYFLARQKLRLANALGSRALRADAVESITCGWLAFVVVGTLVAQLLVGAWWVDALASLGVVWFLIREGREAWQGEDCCDQHCNLIPPRTVG